MYIIVLGQMFVFEKNRKLEKNMKIMGIMELDN